MFFNLHPASNTIGCEPDLVGAYEAIRDDVDGVIEALQAHRSEEVYYYSCATSWLRLSQRQRQLLASFFSIEPASTDCTASTARVFNVPFGRYSNPTICNEANLRRVSEALQNVRIKHESVFNMGRRVRRGDLVYFDPPYDPISKTASFTAYAKGGFGDPEQEQLAEMFARFANRGVHCVLSNSDTPFIRKLYKGFKIETVYARRAINSRADRRGPVGEVLVSSC